MRISDSRALGNTIRTVRRALGVTQAQLALTSGTNRRFVVELERGKPTTQTGKVLAVLRTLGISIDLVPPAGIDLLDQRPRAARKVKRGTPS